MPPKKAAPKAAAAKKAAPKTVAKKAAPKPAAKKAAPKPAAKKAAPKPAAKKAAPAAAKRPRSDTTEPAAKKAKVAGGRPRLDELCKSSGQVYMDAGGVAWSVKLNQTNIGHNNNKYYIIQLIENTGGGGNHACFTRWGRVGESGQQHTATGTLADMQKVFASKFRDKTKNVWETVRANHEAFVPAPGKYDLVETEGGDNAEEVVKVVTDSSGEKVKVLPSKLESNLQSLLNLIFDKDMFKKKMKEMNIDANKMPLGKLTKTQLARGYAALEEIEDVVNKNARRTPKVVETLQQLSSKFYTIIPHDFGRSIPTVIDSAEMVKQKYELLHVLGDIQIAVDLQEAAAVKSVTENPLDVQYQQLGCDLELLKPTSAEYKMIQTYTQATQGYRKCKIRRVFKVDRGEDIARMQRQHGAEKDGRFLLWHGTNIAVVAAILKSGLRIMPHAGGRVGRGLYFASENGKSSAYVGCDGNTGIMFLVEVCMGNAIHRILQDNSRLNIDEVNKLKATSVLACGRQEPDPKKSVVVKGEWGNITVPQSTAVPQAGCEKSSFHQSEYLVYEESRARIKYMLEMEMGY